MAGEHHLVELVDEIVAANVVVVVPMEAAEIVAYVPAAVEIVVAAAEIGDFVDLFVDELVVAAESMDERLAAD